MKRIQAACLEQTIRFASKDSSNLPLARRLAREEANRYLAQLEKSRTKYQIVKEQEAPDGSLLLKLKRQYNYYDCGSYFEEKE